MENRERHNSEETNDRRKMVDGPHNVKDVENSQARSLTNDESAAADPQQTDKSSFHRQEGDVENTGKFDGDIGI